MENYKDEIVDEVRNIRHAYAARFNFDLNKIYKDIVKKEKAERGFKLVKKRWAGRKINLSNTDDGILKVTDRIREVRIIDPP